MYAFGTPTQDPRPLEAAHCAKERWDASPNREAGPRSAFLTVGPRPQAIVSDAQSIASSRISAHEAPVSNAVHEMAMDREVATHSPASYTDYSVAGSASTYSDDKKKNRELEPVAWSYDDKIATPEFLGELETRYPLPAIKGSTLWSKIKYLCFTCYRKLMLIVLMVNVSIIASKIAIANDDPTSFTYRDAATATGANLLVAILMRQEHVINLLFHAACALPYWMPLRLRSSAARFAYSNGGIHAGAGNSALLWYIFYTVLLVQQFEGTPAEEKAISAITAITVLLLVIIIVMAHPFLRRQYHNYWELSHRYCGWTAIALVWAQTVIIAIANSHSKGHSVGLALIASPTFWFLVIITCCLIYPWLWLRRLPVHANKLSSHATELHFHNRHAPLCSATRLSHSPLVENHGFATIPRKDGEKGYSVLVSNAGDWTKKMITQPPSHIWQRGAPTTGVMRICSLFKPVIIVSTGSGIGPCTSFLNAQPKYPSRILWAARFPEATYGSDVLTSVFEADKDAVVVDTKKTGHPDLAALAYALVQEMRAEAVMVISNPKVTRDVVYAMRARGIEAFGAIFDS
ncbi:hypothetical protein LTR08_007153 [Meristemomyces frigidus]|nr:hypothetical protein LTR08_007153 [Meristemomyces frigidus]